MHYAIGDVHGCFDELRALLNKIEEQDKDARFIFVGDLVDRGPKVWETLQWAMHNITSDGKYQSIRGNHEQMALDWWKQYKTWYARPRGADPESYYDISQVLKANIKATGRGKKHSPQDFVEVMKFFESLPYSKKLSITSKWGVLTDFCIVHGWYLFDEPEDSESQHDANLYRRDYWGNLRNKNVIIVYGHTPTINRDFLVRGYGDDRPGLIGYRANSINIDCGCVFGEAYGGYPCMLGAICLENLEEIYPFPIAERMVQLVQERDVFGLDCTKEEYAEYRMEQYRKQFLTDNSHMRVKGEMLKKMGFTGRTERRQNGYPVQKG